MRHAQQSLSFQKELQEVAQADIAHCIASFPKTRFYGSKRRLLPWIHDSLKSLEFDTVLDGFGGTGSVSLLFKAMGKNVTYNDALLSNTISASALLDNMFSRAQSTFFDKIKPDYGFISKTFKGIYFTDAENHWLDGALKEIFTLPQKSSRQIYLYCLFQACLMKRPFNLFHRANLNLRLNKKVDRSFGNMTTWDTAFPIFAKRSLNELQKMNIMPAISHTILPPTDVSNIRPGFDLVYLDPPYINRLKKSDDYMRRYHFLEGMSQYKEWPEMINSRSSLKELPSREEISAWEHKNTFKDRLFSLVNTHRHSTVVLSYVTNAYPDRGSITKYFNQKFKNVTVLKKEFSHALAKQQKVELLFIGRP